MGYSKRQFCVAAFEEIGLASYVFDLQPQDLESALRRLDAMMADWNGKGIRLAYPLPGSPENSDINAESEVPDSANEAIITNLAMRLAPSYGKQVMPMTMATVKSAYNTLVSRAPSWPGVSTWKRTCWMPEPSRPAQAITARSTTLPSFSRWNTAPGTAWSSIRLRRNSMPAPPHERSQPPSVATAGGCAPLRSRDY